MTQKIVYLNGEYLPVEKASISVMDRGFLFGDGIYEVIPVYGKQPLRLDEHMTRLQNSLDMTSIDNPYTNEQWRAIFSELLEKNPGDDRSIYLQITRGSVMERDLKAPDDVLQTVFVMVNPINTVALKEVEKGIKVITVEDFRWHACNIKSISLIANVMLRRKAADQSVIDAIMVRDGKVTEGTASNIFIVKDNVLITPPKSRHLLPGITRDLVLELAEKESILVEVRDIDEAELYDADEIWLTSSTREIAPVVELNEKPIANKKPGQMWETMIRVYQDYKSELRKTS